MSEDLIKRSDATEAVYKALRTPPLKGVLTDTMSLAIALVRGIPSADRPQEWIPCSERLPDKSGEYLAYGIISHVPDHIGDQNIRKDTAIAYYSRSFNEWLGNGVEKVLAWQPKPEPWKGAEDEDN